MAARKNILFIINPISGGKNKVDIPAAINRYLDKEVFNPDIKFTEFGGHASALAEAALAGDTEIVVAAGGDGTINEVACMVLKYKKTLGILPLGSGNGLARFLEIPTDLQKAIALLNKQQTKNIDSGHLCGKPFFNLAGMGFDAHVSAIFAKDKSRGLFGYIRLGLAEVLSYKPQEYLIEIDGKQFTRKAYAISIANSSQYGNDVIVSPYASVTDGFLDVCIIKSFPLIKLPMLVFVMIKRTAKKSNLIEIIQGKQIKITREKEAAVHVDGEPLHMSADLEAGIVEQSLKVIVSLWERKLIIHKKRN
ncbi:diacylglycerol kinase (ATP) [Pedobacter sp. UYP30]|uniref:diacylglycerol/lipid kinase family protein n=1 Tax=Pedobacter sp. UYP30 TaxID=1756400 RepID=UPI0033961BB0